MPALISFFIVLIISLLIVRIAGVALMVTGMAKEAAKFEARSAWTGTGFTSSESEQVVRHPVRRQIVTFLMILRNAGLVGAASTLIISFVNIQQGQGEGIEKLTYLLGGLILLWLIAKSKLVDRFLTNFIARVLNKFTDLETRDHSSLLSLGGDYDIREVHITSENWIENKKLINSGLREEGVMVLGVNRPGSDYIGVPPIDLTIQEGDNLILYGRSQDIDLATKRIRDFKAQKDHEQAVERQENLEENQKQELKK